MYEGNDLTLWIGTILFVWVSTSAVVRQGVEKLKPLYDSLWAGLERSLKSIGTQFGYNWTFSLRPIRNFSIPVFLVIAAYLGVQATGYDVLAGAPRWLTTIDASWHAWITAVWLAFGAILFHDGITWFNDKPPAEPTPDTAVVANRVIVASEPVG